MTYFLRNPTWPRGYFWTKIRPEKHLQISYLVDNGTRPRTPATAKSKAPTSSAGSKLVIEILSVFKGQVVPEISYYDRRKVVVNVDVELLCVNT